MQSVAPKTGSLFIDAGSYTSDYEIFVMQEKQLELLLQSEKSAIKDSSCSPVPGESRSSTLHTVSNTFDIAKLESSNSLLFAECLIEDANKNYHIHKMSHYVVELELSTPNKLQVANTLRTKAIYKDAETEYSTVVEEEKTKGVTYSELLESCQISKKELDAFLYEFEAFQVGELIFVFDLKDRMYRSKKLLLEMFKQKVNMSSMEWKDISLLLSHIPIEASKILLNTIADQEQEKWIINGKKIQRLCALLLFIEKKQYNIKEFLAAMQNLENILVPEAIIGRIRNQNSADTSWIAKNIFPGFQEANLSHLQRTAYIIAGSGKKDPIIEYLDYYQLSGNIKKRFNQLCEKKKEWTKAEIQIWLEEYLPPGQNLDIFLAKNAKLQSIPHPFAKGTIGVYLTK